MAEQNDFEQQGSASADVLASVQKMESSSCTECNGKESSAVLDLGVAAEKKGLLSSVENPGVEPGLSGS